LAHPRDSRRDFLLSLLARGLEAVDGRVRMRAALAGRADLHGAWLLAAGKAAAAMTLGALDALGGRVERALVVSQAGSFGDELGHDARVDCMAGEHPVPGTGSLAAGAAALRMAEALPTGRPLLLLVSGGASSLLESLPEGVSLDDLQRVAHWALSSGEPIRRVNAVRRRLSALKDGRLLARLAHGAVEGYFISDVPGDDPAVVGSGLLAPAGGPAGMDGLPDWLAVMLAATAVPRPPALRVPVQCVGSLDDALDAVETAARAAGMPVVRSRRRLHGPAVDVARQVCHALAQGPAGLWLGGGETTVVLPARVGRGGRNQHLALAAARAIAGRDDLLLLAAGTDGADGNTADAGALVDGGSVERGRDAGLDPDDCLARADSGAFLEAGGDLVHTGSTGTNVGDVVLGLRWEAGHGLGVDPCM
jgi:hydroxypyruvate reductase